MSTSTSQRVQAARRHYRDAEYLLGDPKIDRKQSADHLFGLAAECAAWVVYHKYAQRPGQRYCEPPKEHINKLWPQFFQMFNGSAPRDLTSRLPSPTCFDKWHVNQRYDNDKAVSESHIEQHRVAARKLITVAEELAL